jgi:FHS family L-fucose permease-like MFS transporter
MSPRAAFTLIVALFFTFGFLTALNDVLVADLRSIFHLSYRSATLVQLTFFSTCFLASFPASRIVSGLGFQSTMMTGLLLMSAGALFFVHAAGIASFTVFLVALIVMAAGSTVLQTATGPYVCLLEPDEPCTGSSDGAAAARFSLTLAVNSVGAMLAPAFGATLLLRHATFSFTSPATSITQSADLRLPYLGIALSLALLALVVRRSNLPPVLAPFSSIGPRTRYLDLRHHPRLLFGVLAMVLYVGAEIGISSLLINFLGQHSTLALTPERAAFLATFYGAGAMAGRFLGRLILPRVHPARLLIAAAAAAIALTLTAVFTAGPIAAIALIAVGLANSVMVPILYTTSIAGLGPLTAKGSGLLVAALVGGALIPYAMGALADRVGLHLCFLLPAVSYAAILAYGLYTTPQRQPA